jgi:hypothetical protein
MGIGNKGKAEGFKLGLCDETTKNEQAKQNRTFHKAILFDIGAGKKKDCMFFGEIYLYGLWGHKPLYIVLYEESKKMPSLPRM